MSRLEEMLEEARKHPVTEAELREQRKSWVRGEMSIGLDRDEAAYRAKAKETPMRKAYETPSRPCPYCGESCEAEWCDSVGWRQVGPYRCDACSAFEAGPCDTGTPDYDPATGWYKPKETPNAE